VRGSLCGRCRDVNPAAVRARRGLAYPRLARRRGYQRHPLGRVTHFPRDDEVCFRDDVTHGQWPTGGCRVVGARRCCSPHHRIPCYSRDMGGGGGGGRGGAGGRRRRKEEQEEQKEEEDQEEEEE